MSQSRSNVTTARGIKSLKPESKKYTVSVGGYRGLYVRVYPTSRKSFYYRYRNGEKQEWYKIGDFGAKAGELSLADAGEELVDLRKIVKDYGSVFDHRELETNNRRQTLETQRTEKEIESYTVAKLCREYIDDASKKIASWAEVDRALKKYIIPKMGTMPVTDVTRKDVISALNPLNKAGKYVQSNRVLAYLRRCFNWGIGQSKVDDWHLNPCDHIEKNEEKSKDRVLSDSELKRFLRNLPKSSMSETEQDLLKFILLTGCRPGEASSASIDDVDQAEATLTISNTKNGKTHVVPLSLSAMQIAVKRKEVSKWLFPMKTRPKQHMGRDRVQKPLRESYDALKVHDFTPHDLRRTMATGLAKLKCPELLISLALNHTVPGITSIYNRYGYADELREWYTKWNLHVDTLKQQTDEVSNIG